MMERSVVEQNIFCILNQKPFRIRFENNRALFLHFFYFYFFAFFDKKSQFLCHESMSVALFFEPSPSLFSKHIAELKVFFLI